MALFAASLSRPLDAEPSVWAFTTDDLAKTGAGSYSSLEVDHFSYWVEGHAVIWSCNFTLGVTGVVTAFTLTLPAAIAGLGLVKEQPGFGAFASTTVGTRALAIDIAQPSDTTIVFTRGDNSGAFPEESIRFLAGGHIIWATAE